MNFKKLDEYFEFLKCLGVPFSSVKVVKDGSVVYQNIFGEKDNGEKIGYDDKFYFYSASKMLAVTSAMMLYDEGKIKLEDKVSKFIPEFENLFVGEEKTPCKTDLTIFHLLTMTNGYGYDIKENLKASIQDKTASTLDVLKALAKDPVWFEPGENFAYGMGHDILAGVVEVVSGMKYSEFVKLRIFEPLGMNDSCFQPTEQIKQEMFIQSRFCEETGEFKPENKDNNFIFTDNYDSGGAGLISTTNDYIKLVKALANYGVCENGTVLLKKETIDLIRKDHLTDAQKKNFFKGPHYSYGLGVRTLIDGESSKGPVGEFGWDSAACSFFAIDVENNVGIFYGCHTLGWGKGYEYHYKLRDIVYECLEK